MPQTLTNEHVSLDRRSQILEAAVVCFAKRGFHQASMHDISAEAGISVGLIYRYFQNKEAVIAAMADRHKSELGNLLERDVLNTAMDGVTKLIARSPEGQNAANGQTPRELAELIFAVARGMLMLDILQPAEMTAAERRARQLGGTRRLWRSLFKSEATASYA